MRTGVRPPRPAPGAGTSSPLPRVRRPQRSTGSVGRWAGAPGVITQTLAPRASQSKDRALGARSLRGSRAGARPGSPCSCPRARLYLKFGEGRCAFGKDFHELSIQGVGGGGAGQLWEGSLVPGWLWAAGREVRE